MYSKILIANRGEIAVRIIRACREMGIKTVAVYSTVDRESLHVGLADETICIGPAAASESYLKIPAIISAAEVSGADAIHPGYGFLSEDSAFAEKCVASNIDFIGPKHSIIKMMGDKIGGRQAAQNAGVPTIPGTKGALNNKREALEASEKIGFPLIIKAKAGGGGKGMRVVYSKSNFLKSFDLAKLEGEAAFGNGDVFIEKYLQNPRHIEVQVLGDKFNNYIHLGERDCSLQRRHQKIIEESPASNLPDKVREKMWSASIRLIQDIGYDSAGTIEFLVDDQYNFYFIEMNTRLQVEHPITEIITGIDLVKEQIKISAGEKLGITQQDVNFNNHAIECRINAESPTNFMPSPGKIIRYREPGGFGVRVDSGVYQGYDVVPYYDSLLAKLICFGKDRNEARIRMLRALDEYQIDGIETIIPLQYRILSSLYYEEGKIHTGLVESLLKEI
ncbi:MAG: acetyl-CoA carboxylase biotin carboxylase subunit [SAR324 cluster bacterium]|nr:acetyl-CoA carboxylase biotin carboxylase subunit [SAR324 cluster bacterium]